MWAFLEGAFLAFWFTVLAVAIGSCVGIPAHAPPGVLDLTDVAFWSAIVAAGVFRAAG